MSRVKAGSVTRSRHKKIIKRAKGYFGRRKNTFKVANQAVEKAGQYAYRDRKVKKRECLIFKVVYHISKLGYVESTLRIWKSIMASFYTVWLLQLLRCQTER